MVADFTGAGIDDPTAIADGPDGALWFTNYGNSSIGRITTAGVVTNYTSADISAPLGIATGSDGALWFTNFGNNSIGRITTSGVVTDFTGGGINEPTSMTAGPDGALWFIDVGAAGTNSIGRISTTGVVSNYAGEDQRFAYQITAGPDGALWFSEDGDSIGRITTAGVASLYTSREIEGAGGVTAGPDGALWFTNTLGNSIGRITAVPSISVSPDSGAPGKAVAVSGEGYSPGEQVNVRYSTGLASPYPSVIVICSATTEPNGTFSCLGHIPPSSIAGPQGGHAIRSIGKTSGAVARMTFTLS